MTFTRQSLVVAVASLVISSMAVASGASGVSATIPTCKVSQLKVTAGATYNAGSKYPAGTRLMPIYFTNKAKTCHLEVGGPEVIAYRHVHTTQESRPVVASPEKYAVLDSRARQQALIEITPLSSAQRAKASCGAETATGVLVQDFATPTKSWIFFTTKLTDVCFYAGPKTVTSNIKLSLVNPKA